MVGEEILVEGSDISDEDLEAAICNHLGLPPPEPKKNGILGRLLNSDLPGWGHILNIKYFGPKLNF